MSLPIFFPKSLPLVHSPNLNPNPCAYSDISLKLGCNVGSPPPVNSIPVTPIFLKESNACLTF
jgi:hypothetical protein